MVKFIFITGGVLSSVGKGVVTASIGKILQVRGYKVSVIKIDPYLNVDCGTMNPYQHGEIFVTDDGGEIDLDIGHYERFLDINLTKDHNITTGQVYWTVIERERRGDYLGKCVQIVPHITDEIKRRIYTVAEREPIDVLLTEVGGTVGDIEGLPYLEAIRQIRLEKGYENTMFVHVALVPVLDTTGEEKTKPLQHSVNELRRIGIQPDIIVARCVRNIGEETKAKIALFGTIPREAVFCSYTLQCVYQAPLILDEQGMGEYVVKRLALNPVKPDWSEWKRIVGSFLTAKYEVKIAMVGKYATLADSYVSINEAVKHAAAYCNARARIDWIEAEEFESEENIERLLNYDGIIVPPGFGARGTEGKILAADYARRMDIPLLGICFGFQMAIVAFARYVCGLKDANSTENDPESSHPVIDLMVEQRGVKQLGGTMRLGAQPVKLVPGTTAYKLYGCRDVITERHRHRWEVNVKYWGVLQEHGMVFSGFSIDGTRVEIFELPDRYFYMGTQFHPEFKSRPGKPSPPYYGFVKACLSRKLGLSKAEFIKNL